MTVRPGAEKAKGDLINVYNYLTGKMKKNKELGTHSDIQ